MEPNCWLVFQWEYDEGDKCWKHCVRGVFNSKASANALCTSDMFYVFPMTMNEVIPEGPFENPVAYYPHGEPR